MTSPPSGGWYDGNRRQHSSLPDQNAGRGQLGRLLGADTVVDHINDLLQSGTFVMAPDYNSEKIVQLSRDVMQTYISDHRFGRLRRPERPPQALSDDR